MKTSQRLFLTTMMLLFFLSCSKEAQIDEGWWNDEIVLQMTKSGISKDKVHISSEDAVVVADIFNRKKVHSTRTVLSKQIGEISTLFDDVEKPWMYIINYEDNNGFVIVSATKKFFPIVAYSDKGNFNLSEINHNGASVLLEEYKTIMMNNESQPDSIIDQYRKKWLEFEEFQTEEQDVISTRILSDYEVALKKEEQRRIWTDKGYECHDFGAIRYFFSPEHAEGYMRDICEHTHPDFDCERVNLLLIKRYTETTDPLLKTAWHQGYPLNVDAPNGLAGCVPVAIAQIANYHQWPHTYNWSQIPINGSSAELERFILDVRNFAKVTYGSEGTSSTLSKAVGAFGKLNYTATSMNYNREQTIQEIKYNRRPVYMQGVTSEDKGHAWVCDGYKVEKVQYATLIYGDEIYMPGRPSQHPDYYFFGGTTDNTEYLNMNWGWGDDLGNGWYVYDYIYNSVVNKDYKYNRNNINISPNK